MIVSFLGIFVLLLIMTGVLRYSMLSKYDTPIKYEWSHYVNKYPLTVLVGSSDLSISPKIYEEVIDTAGDCILLVLSTYRVKDENLLVLECFTQVARDTYISESHKLIKVFDSITPDIYDVYFAEKELINNLGVKEYIRVSYGK